MSFFGFLDPKNIILISNFIIIAIIVKQICKKHIFIGHFEKWQPFWIWGEICVVSLYKALIWTLGYLCAKINDCALKNVSILMNLIIICLTLRVYLALWFLEDSMENVKYVGCIWRSKLYLRMNAWIEICKLTFCNCKYVWVNTCMFIST